MRQLSLRYPLRRRVVAALTILLAAALLPATSVVTNEPRVERAAAPIIREAPDSESAVRAAIAQKAPVRVADMTTPTRVVDAQPDGTMTATLHAYPQRVLRDGRWIGIDTTLVRRPDGTVAPRAVEADLLLSGGGAKTPLLRYGREGRSIALTWPGKLPEPVLTGATATYPEVLPGVDLRMRAEVDGYSQHLVVKDARAARQPALRRIRLGLSTQDVKLTVTRKGGLEARTAKGAVAFSAPPSRMWDPQQMHGYTYSNNNPVTFADPTGLLFGFIKKALNGIKKAVNWAMDNVVKHVGPITGMLAIGMAAIPFLAPAAAVLGTVSFFASALSAAHDCSGGGSTMDCIVGVTGAIPGVGKIAAGLGKHLRYGRDLASHTSSSAAMLRGGASKADDLAQQAQAAGRNPHQWLQKDLRGTRGQIADNVATVEGSTWWASCDVNNLSFCESQQAFAAPSQYIKWIQADNFVELPKPFYRHDFSGPMLAGGTRAKNAGEWQFGPGGFAGVLKGTNKTKFVAPPSAPPPPPKRSVPGKNNSYQTPDGRTCNYGGGMCAV